jgi:hypothetical protein
MMDQFFMVLSPADDDGLCFCCIASVAFFVFHPKAECCRIISVAPWL